MGFNKEQLEAINQIDGAVIVSAPAGSGKSTLLIGRIENMISQGINQEDILLTTFTNESANDLKSKLNDKGYDNVRVGTFHSVCRNILIQEGINIDKRPPANYIIQNKFKSLRLDDKILVKDILSWIGYQKNHCYNSSSDSFAKKESAYDEYNLRAYFKAYEDLMEENKCYDFEDFLILAMQVLVQDIEGKYSVKYLMVDEFQDSNALQIKIMQLICPSRNVCVVGDTKQSLYGFRGSLPTIMRDFVKLYPEAKVVKLKMNYRSCKNIVEQSNVFSRYYFGCDDLYADAEAFNKENGTINRNSFIDVDYQAVYVANKVQQWLEEGVEPNQIAILYRKNKCSFEIENELKNRNIAYSISGTNSFFNRTESRIFLAILRLIQNTNDDSAIEELMEIRVEPFKYIAKNIVRELIDYASRNDISLFQACNTFPSSNYSVKRNLGTFVQNIKDLIVLHNNGTDLYSLVNKVQRLFKIVSFIEDKYDEQESIDEHLAGMESFKKFIKSNTLDSFLKFVYSDIEQGKKKKKLSKDEICLRTIHASKGLQWRKVILVSVEDGTLPSKNADIVEEACAFYVGVTRAEETFELCEIGTGNTFTDSYFEVEDFM